MKQSSIWTLKVRPGHDRLMQIAKLKSDIDRIIISLANAMEAVQQCPKNDTEKLQQLISDIENILIGVLDGMDKKID